MITSKKIVNDGDLVFSSGANEEHAISCMFFCNTDELSTAYLDIYVVPGSDPNSWLSDIGLVVKNVSIAPTETFAFDTEKLVLGDGDAVLASVRYEDLAVGDGIVSTVSSVRVR